MAIKNTPPKMPAAPPLLIIDAKRGGFALRGVAFVSAVPLNQAQVGEQALGDVEPRGSTYCGTAITISTNFITPAAINAATRLTRGVWA